MQRRCTSISLTGEKHGRLLLHHHTPKLKSELFYRYPGGSRMRLASAKMLFLLANPH